MTYIREQRGYAIPQRRFAVRPTRITLLVTQTLETLGIPYAASGSLASSVHGVMRSTLDVDIFICTH